ncbi:MAG: Hpt domain-containing protein [Bacillota bacterium]|nr:Hpt domain-containing protein [Bacillota bacterium]
MSSEQMQRKLRQYGADMAGISSRFDDDYDFYAFCLATFFEDNNFARLAQAIEAQDIRAGFEAAHALKGISANLGLTPFSSAVSELAEALRLPVAEDIQPKYQRFMQQLEALSQLREQE